MPNDATKSARYWLLVNNLPTGPFDLSLIRAKREAGTVSGAALVCPVGGKTWFPLDSLPVAPVVEPSPQDHLTRSVYPVAQLVLSTTVSTPLAPSFPVATARSSPASDSPGSIEPPKQTATSLKGMSPSPSISWGNWCICIVGVAVVGWLLYSWFRPLQPREVCERFNKTKTAREAAKYTTLNLVPALEAMEKNGVTEDENDVYEFTQECEGPPEMGGYLVGMRGHFQLEPGQGKRQIDVVFHLIKSDGWKIEDMYFLAVDRRPLEQPISFATQYSLMVDGSARPLAEPSKTNSGAKQAKSWMNNERLSLYGKLGVLLQSKTAKGMGLAFLGLLWAVGRFGKGTNPKPHPGSAGEKSAK